MKGKFEFSRLIAASGRLQKVYIQISFPARNGHSLQLNVVTMHLLYSNLAACFNQYKSTNLIIQYLSLRYFLFFFLLCGRGHNLHRICRWNDGTSVLNHSKNAIFLSIYWHSNSFQLRHFRKRI